MTNEILVTGDHGLKSDNPYDYSDCIADTTHHLIRFTEYEDGKVVRSWDTTLSNKELFELLKPKLREDKE